MSRHVITRPDWAGVVRVERKKTMISPQLNAKMSFTRGSGTRLARDVNLLHWRKTPVERSKIRTSRDLVTQVRPRVMKHFRLKSRTGKTKAKRDEKLFRVVIRAERLKRFNTTLFPFAYITCTRVSAE